MNCPKCNSDNIFIQQIQTGSVGMSQNKVVIVQPKKSKGCMYWLIIGWWLEPIIFLSFGWIKLLFGGSKKSGINLNANKNLTKTVCTCQSCGHSWNK